MCWFFQSLPPPLEVWGRLWWSATNVHKSAPNNAEPVKSMSHPDRLSANYGPPRQASPYHHGNPNKWRERKRARESSANCTSLPAVNGRHTPALCVCVWRVQEPVFPIAACPISCPSTRLIKLASVHSIILFCQLECRHTERHGQFLTSIRDMSHPHPALTLTHTHTHMHCLHSKHVLVSILKVVLGWTPKNKE